MGPERYAVCEVGARAAPYLHAVVVVETAVPVGVGIEEIAQLGAREGGEITGIAVYERLYIVKVGLVAHDTVDGDDIELVDGTSLLNLVDPVYRGHIASEPGHAVAHIAHVESEPVCDVADAVAPVERELEATVIDTSGILVGHRGGAVLERGGESDEDSLGRLVVEVERPAQTVVEHREVDADVGHICLLPRQRRVGEYGLGESSGGRAPEHIPLGREE